MKNESFLAYFMRILNSCAFSKFQLRHCMSTLGVRHLSRIPQRDCHLVRHSHNLMFLKLWTALS